jgi:hypothetical protein
MNIFVLHKHPRVAARYHCDKHVIKMITESCQMISTCLKIKYSQDDDLLYKITHHNHPCNKWLRESDGNLIWLMNLTRGLIKEYDTRYKKPNKFKTARAIIEHLSKLSFINKSESMTAFKLAMPDEYVTNDVVESYRRFYIFDKNKKGKVQYKYSRKPKWLYE